MTSTHLDEIAAIIRHVEAAAYERGKADAKREILKHLTSMDAESKAPVATKDHKGDVAVRTSGIDRVKPACERQRAPKGIVPKFVKRVLENEPGLTPKQIMSRADTDFEKMIKPASVRSELRSGAEKGEYINIDGLWEMADEGFDEAGDSSHEDNSPASNTNHERTDYASSVDVDDLI